MFRAAPQGGLSLFRGRIDFSDHEAGPGYTDRLHLRAGMRRGAAKMHFAQPVVMVKQMHVCISTTGFLPVYLTVL